VSAGDGREVVRAAGGAVWRKGPDGLEVLLVHRPRYDDWSLPKGKADPGEDDEATAVREVEEETGLRLALGEELPPTRYVDHRGRAKVVRYWAMPASKGSADAAFVPADVVPADFVPNHEVDEVAWLPLSVAADRLSYARDRRVLDALRDVVAT
jgi:8-oxo-dGTP diphosphatase